MWPWPWSYRPGFCAQHIVSWESTFLLSHFKIHQGKAKLWTGHEKKTLFWPLTSKCYFDLGAIDLGLACNISSHDGQHFCQVISKSIKEWHRYGLDSEKKTIFLTFDISSKSFQNPSRNGKVMDQTRKSVTLTLALQTWVLWATHCFMMLNISAKSFQNPSRIYKVMDRTKHTYIRTCTYIMVGT